MKKVAIAIAIAVLGTSVSAFAATSTKTPAAASVSSGSTAASTTVNLNTPAAKLVTQVINNQGTITQSFPAVGGLTGFVVQSTQGQNQNNNGIVYADQKGQYLFVGSIINAQGQDMTQLYTNEYINSKIAGPAYLAALQTATFTSGSDKAPHKAVIIIDPNCIYCHMLYQQLQPLIANDQVQIRWVPVAFRDPSSPGKAAAILAGPDSAALLDQNEKTFNNQSEQGAITPLQPNPNDPVVTKLFSDVAQNTQFFSKFGFQGTPTILYKQSNGTMVMVPGYVQGQAFQSMIANMGPNW